MPTESQDRSYRIEGQTSFELFSNDYVNSGPTPTHLVFLIHGIGYKMYEETKFQENMFALSNTTQEVLFSNYADSGMRIYYLPITWAAELHALTSVDGRMNKITLPTIPGMRVITNDCLSDVLYYFTDYHRQQLLDIICVKMNKAFEDFKKVYPDFQGHTGLISHSLGGVISYDLLSVKNQEGHTVDDDLYAVAFPRTNYPKLDFEPTFLFTMGAPVGAVMVMRGLRYEHFSLSEDTKFMNIFNPYDPLAYRIEPLISGEYDELEPVPIPVCEMKESASYLPNFTSFLPERPNIMRAARTMLANFNLVEGHLSDNEEERLSEQSDDEYSIPSDGEEVQATNDCIKELKVVDKDDKTTRRLSSLNVTAIGFSTYRGGSVTDRLHELRHSSSNQLLSRSLDNQRPSSLYQTALNSFYPPKSSTRSKPTKSRSRPKPLKNRRNSFPPPLNSLPSARHPPTSGFLDQTNHDSLSEIDRSSGNESDDERSPAIPVTTLIPDTPSSCKEKRPKRELPTKLSRSKTWAHLAPIEGHEEEMMWLWGGIGYGLTKESSTPTSAWGVESARQSSYSTAQMHLESEPKPDMNNVLDIDESPPFAPEELTTSHQDHPTDYSHPKLISNLTSTSRIHLNNRYSDPETSTSPNSFHQVPVLNRNGSSTSIPVTCTSAQDEAAQVLAYESKLKGELGPDATYPHPTTSNGPGDNLKRVDYCIQTKVMSNLSFEYIVGLGAHFSYWNSKDVSNLILKTLQDLPRLDINPPGPTEQPLRSASSQAPYRSSTMKPVIPVNHSTGSLPFFLEHHESPRHPPSDDPL